MPFLTLLDVPRYHAMVKFADDAVGTRAKQQLLGKTFCNGVQMLGVYQGTLRTAAKRNLRRYDARRLSTFDFKQGTSQVSKQIVLLSRRSSARAKRLFCSAFLFEQQFVAFAKLDSGQITIES